VVRRVRCLVVVPVGDLAAQVYKVFSDYCQHTELKVGLILGRLVVLEFGLRSIFAGLGLRLGLEQKGLGLETAGHGLGLGKICNQVQFQFSLCTFAVICLGRVTFCQPLSYTQPKICYLLSIFCGINTWICLFLFLFYWYILQ